MENSWQRKCGTMWQSVAPSVVSPAQEPQNQIPNAGYHIRSCVQAKPTSSALRMAPEPLLSWTSSVNSCNMDNTELGSSLLSVLSGPQCIFPSEVSIASCNANGFTIRNEVSLLNSGILSQNLNSQNVEAGSDLCSVLSSKARVGANQGSKSGPSNVLQDGHINLEKLELLKAGMHQNSFNNESGIVFPSLRMGYDGSIPSNAWKLHNSHNTGVLHKLDPSISCLSSTLTTGCPRVFCLNLSGDLLLSNTGLLGVICSCHGVHMSISKFLEHSGLCNINPGDAVRLDSGETIAQWRKVYFHKFGIKIPEDHCGWDWPEGFSVTAGLVKHCPMVPSVSKHSGLCNQDGSLASVQPIRCWNSTLYPRNFHMVQNMHDQFVHAERQRNAQECLSSSSESNLHSVTKNQKMTYTSDTSTMSNLVGVKGPDNICQPLSSYISKSGDPFVFCTNLQNLKPLGKDIDIGRNSGSLVQRDIVSSNVELRLGQPSQQGQGSGNSIRAAIGSHMGGSHGQPPNAFSLEQHVPKSCSVAAEDGRQHGYLANCLPSSSRTEQIQWDHVNKICGVSNAVSNAFQIEQFKGDAAGSSVISRSVAHLKYPLEGRIHSKSVNDVISGNHVMVSKVHSESPPIARTGQFSFPLFGGEASDREFSSNLPDSQKHGNCEKVRYAIDRLQGAAELSFGSHSKSKGRMWSFGGGESGSDHRVYSAGKDESTVLCHFSGGMTNEPNRGNSFNYFGQALYPAQKGQLISDASRSFNSLMDFGRVLSTQAVPMGFSATKSLGIPSLTPLSKKETVGGGPNLRNEKVRMSAVQHVSEFSNQNHPSTFKHIPEQDGLRNFCEKSQFHISSSASDKRINEINHTHMLNTSEVATQSFCSANFSSSGKAKLSSVTDKLCNFSMLSQGRYCHGKDAEIQNQFASDMQSTRQLFLRLGGTESVNPSSEAGKYSQGMPDGCFPSKYGLIGQTNSLTERNDQKGETILAESKDQEANAGNMMATLLGPKLDESCTFVKKVNCFGHNENMKQNTQKAECNSFLWRDVPRKVVGKCSLACVETSADSSNGRCRDEVAGEAARKCCDESAYNVGSFKDQELSNVSSGCSAPVVTQASIEVNKKDSSTVDAEDARHAGNPLVDEGSGIERCWSSDDGVDSERNAEFSGFASNLNLGHKRTSKPLLCKPNRSLIDELRFRDSLRLRKMQKQSHTDNCNQEKDASMQKSERGSKIWKRRPVKWKKLTSSFSPFTVSVSHNDNSECAGDAELHPQSVSDMKMLSQCGQGKFEGCVCAVGRNIKQNSGLSLSTDISQDGDVCRIHHVEEEKTDIEMNLNANRAYSETTGRKRLRLSGATQTLRQIHVNRSDFVDSDVTAKETPVNCNMACSQPGNISQRPRRPVVCGKYGVIANANSLKSAKIVSLRELLKAPSRCRLPDANKVDLSSVKLLKKATIRGSNAALYSSSKNKEEENGKIRHAVHNVLNPRHSMDEMKTACPIGNEEYDNLSHVRKKRRCHGNKIQGTPDGCQIIELRRKYKEVRKRSLHELTTKDNYPSYVKFPIMKNVKSMPQTKSRFLCNLTENAEADKISAKEICNAKISNKDGNCQRIWDLDVFCSVCGSSSKDENNDLLKCSHCLIKVHQACYGISKVPKAHWYCRPCKTGSKNIVCVLCGYGEGAMTQALRSHNSVKSLLQAWNTMAEFNSKNLSSKSSEIQIKMLSSSNSVGEGDPFLVMRPAHKDLPSLALCSKEVSEHKDSISISSPSAASVECNSITAGVLDPTVKQWVHMVCGLWTPGTRCPNVDTMSAFDVSGACTPKTDVACSICERRGGCCIRCRVVGCDIQFHPWCAHQKGLLQSEVEGDDNECVGFYGRCPHHVMNHQFEPDSCLLESGNANHVEKKLTCARTEGYKGRKQDGVHYNLPPHAEGYGRSLFVPQEQLDAWIHINRQKPRRKGPLKLSTSEIEHDRRKEYARYKQSRGWKHLVVYKSGIHGLGLYTSQFISRGAMVVEYVGEIVGLRVADKRETEYQSGKKLQYKSACYFFRIDKEYIIDATRKGGIARFVNHSCQPNCVAEIISVRNEKKVVFFAERDIYPGEEITYDYHFNHEDEGKKIPCYCNSKNCRRYLN